MRYLISVCAVAALVIATSAGTCIGGTSLSGSLAGAWLVGEDNTASALSAGLGATYRPDAVTPSPATEVATGKFTIQPSNFVFWTQQYFNDDADMNLTGAGYSLFKAPNFELLGEVGAVFKNVAVEKFRVGAVGLADARFSALGQGMSFKVGGGYCDAPVLILSLGFETK